MAITYKGVPCAGRHTTSHVRDQTFPVEAPSLLGEVCVFLIFKSFFFFRTSHLCIVCLLPLVLWTSQIVYGYCEVQLPWKCSVPLDITSSAHFPRNPADASNWLRGAPRVSAYSPCDVHSTQFKSDNLSLCSCEKLLLSLWRSYPLFPSSAECDSVSPPLFSPLLPSLKVVLISLSIT